MLTEILSTLLLAVLLLFILQLAKYITNINATLDEINEKISKVIDKNENQK